MAVIESLYAACAIAFLALIGLVVARGRVNRAGLPVIAACLVTAIWAASLALPGLVPLGAAQTIDSVRLSAWLLLIVALVGAADDRSAALAARGPAQRRWSPAPTPLLIAGLYCGAAVTNSIVCALSDPGSGLVLSQLLFRVGFSVGGLLAIENLWRNSAETRRQHLWALCLSLGAIFAFELFLYADRLMLRGGDAVLPAGRAVVGLAAVPLLAVAMARYRDWRIDIHVSRAVVLHTAALVASGAFFLAVAAVGVLIRESGGRWGPLLQLFMLIGSALVLASVLGSNQVRNSLRRLITRNFFSHRYDYRIEWRRFVETVSEPGPGGDGLAARIVKALAQIVESPAGTLWCLRPGLGYAPDTGWNQAVAGGARLAPDHPFVAGFRAGDWVQENTDAAVAWPAELGDAWVAVPLQHDRRIIGFVVLSAPRRVQPLDWEAFDLLRAAARQAASYLAEEWATRALLDAELLTDYSKRFAFVVHDIKNLASQLGMIVTNAKRYIDEPDFQRDMLQTMQDAVARMNRLLAQLRAGAQPRTPQLVDPDIVLGELVRELSVGGAAIETQLGAGGCMVAIDSDRLRSILSHVISNATEAGGAGEAVLVTTCCASERLVIDVVDHGAGMDGAFVRDDLFRPFRSTKSGGYGIGAYQTRELVRMSGGDLEIISEKGAGTIARITLPVQAHAIEVATAAI